MRVLLTGATGYIGSKIAARLNAHGHAVVAAVRDNSAVERLRVNRVVAEPVIAPLEAPDALAEAARSADAVIHTAFNHDPKLFQHGVAGALRIAMAEERPAIAAMAGALAGTGKALVCTTACGILGNTGPVPVDEHHRGQADFEPAARRAIEQEVIAQVRRGVRAIVIRPPLLTHSGEARGGSLPRMKAAAKQLGMAGYLDEGENRLSCGHVDDVAELYVLAMEKASYGTIYNAAGGDVRMRDVAEAIARACGVQAKSLSFEEASRVWGSFQTTLFSIDNRLSNARARTELGWRPYETTASIIDDILR